MDNTLGKRIATHRKRLGMTQEQLADKLGITAQAVSKWENDQSCPDISVLPLLADIFCISTDELLGRNLTPVVTEATASDDSYECIYGDEDEDDDDCEDGNNVHINMNMEVEGNGKGKLALFGMSALFLTVGVLFLLSKVLDWNCSFWDILWPSSLLVFGIFGLIGKISLFWLACAGVGAFFLVSNLVPLPLELDKGVLWAAIIIVCGVMLLLDALRKKHRRNVHFHNDSHSHKYQVEDGFLHCSNTFGEENQIVIADVLNGGKVSNSFGEYTIDFSGVTAVSANCTIEASCSFGELILLVPKHYTVTHKTAKSFASFSVDGNPDEKTTGTIFLNASISFGDLTIRYI